MFYAQFEGRIKENGWRRGRTIQSKQPQGLNHADEARSGLHSEGEKWKKVTKHALETGSDRMQASALQRYEIDADRLDGPKAKRAIKENQGEARAAQKVGSWPLCACSIRHVPLNCLIHLLDLGSGRRPTYLLGAAGIRHRLLVSARRAAFLVQLHRERTNNRNHEQLQDLSAFELCCSQARPFSSPFAVRTCTADSLPP